MNDTSTDQNNVKISSEEEKEEEEELNNKSSVLLSQKPPTIKEEHKEKGKGKEKETNTPQTEMKRVKQRSISTNNQPSKKRRKSNNINTNDNGLLDTKLSKIELYSNVLTCDSNDNKNNTDDTYTSCFISKSMTIARFIDDNLICNKSIKPLSSDPAYQIDPLSTLERVQTPKDGNCYFSSLSFYLYGHFGKVEKLRYSTYNYASIKCFGVQVEDLKAMRLDEYLMSFKSVKVALDDEKKKNKKKKKKKNNKIAFVKSVSYILAKIWQTNVKCQHVYGSDKFITEYRGYILNHLKNGEWTDCLYAGSITADLHRTIVIPHVINDKTMVIERLLSLDGEDVADEIHQFFYIIYYCNHIDLLTVVRPSKIINSSSSSSPLTSSSSIVNNATNTIIPLLKQSSPSSILSFESMNKTNNDIGTNKHNGDIKKDDKSLSKNNVNSRQPPNNINDPNKYIPLSLNIIFDEDEGIISDDSSYSTTKTTESNNYSDDSKSNSKYNTEMTLYGENSDNKDTDDKNMIMLYCSDMVTTREIFIRNLPLIKSKKERSKIFNLIVPTNVHRSIIFPPPHNSDVLVSNMTNQVTRCCKYNTNEIVNANNTKWIYHVYASDEYDVMIFSLSREILQTTGTNNNFRTNVLLRGYREKKSKEPLNFIISDKYSNNINTINNYNDGINNMKNEKNNRYGTIRRKNTLNDKEYYGKHVIYILYINSSNKTKNGIINDKNNSNYIDMVNYLLTNSIVF